MCQWAVNIKRRCPRLFSTGSAAGLRRRKTLSEAGRRYPCGLIWGQFSPSCICDSSEYHYQFSIWSTGLSPDQCWGETSVKRGCAGSDRKREDDEQCYSTWRWVHAVPPRGEEEKRREQSSAVRKQGQTKRVTPVLQKMNRPTQNLLKGTFLSWF